MRQLIERRLSRYCITRPRISALIGISGCIRDSVRRNAREHRLKWVESSSHGRQSHEVHFRFGNTNSIGSAEATEDIQQ